MVVGDDISIGRDDEARAERLTFACLGLGSAATALATEKLFEWRAGKGVRLNLDALTRGNIDHRGLQLFGQVGKARWRAGARYDALQLRVLVLRHLGADCAGRNERKRGAAKQESRSDSINISHGRVILLVGKTGANHISPAISKFNEG